MPPLTLPLSPLGRGRGERENFKYIWLEFQIPSFSFIVCLAEYSCRHARNSWEISSQGRPSIFTVEGACLFFAIRVTQAVVFSRIHGTRHFIRQRCTMTILERPHALNVKKANAVAVV
jgi:hypothetical protein